MCVCVCVDSNLTVTDRSCWLLVNIYMFLYGGGSHTHTHTHTLRCECAAVLHQTEKLLWCFTKQTCSWLFQTSCKSVCVCVCVCQWSAVTVCSGNALVFWVVSIFHLRTQRVQSVCIVSRWRWASGSVSSSMPALTWRITPTSAAPMTTSRWRPHTHTHAHTHTHTHTHAPVFLCVTLWLMVEQFLIVYF